MKVLVATDFHGYEAAFENFASKAEEEKAEILVICGDITHFGTIQEAKYLLSLLTDLRLPVLFVPGNCDPPALADIDVEGAMCIHGKSVSYGDLTFIGVGGSPSTPLNTLFEMTEEKIAQILNEGSKNIDNRWVILVSHTPPKGTSVDKIHLGEHVGSSSVRSFVEERKPSAVFCGHIHEARGKDVIGGTIIVNPGPARHGYCAISSFNMEIEVELGFL